MFACDKTKETSVFGYIDVTGVTDDNNVPDENIVTDKHNVTDVTCNGRDM